MSTLVARRAGPLLRKCITSCNHILREILVYLGHPTRQVYNNFWRHSRMPDLAGIVIKLFLTYEFFIVFVLNITFHFSFIYYARTIIQIYAFIYFVLLMNDGKLDIIIVFVFFCRFRT